MRADFVERALSFDCAGKALIGVLALPAAVPAVPLGVVIVVGGPQYRAGSHRQFVSMARHLAGAGSAVLRFDVRGMGDGEGPQRNFEQLTPDIAAAIDALCAHCPGVQSVALWGLCDGASAALLYVDERPRDARVAALCLVNPWVRSAASQARTQVKHYYLQRLRERGFWTKLLRGNVALSALSGLAGSVRLALAGTAGDGGSDAAGNEQEPYPQRMARAWKGFGGAILLALCGQDYTAKEFIQFIGDNAHWRGAHGHPGLYRIDLPEADHTLSDRRHAQVLQAHCAQWLEGLRLPASQE